MHTTTDDYVQAPTCHCGITDMAPDGFPICHECWSRFIGQLRKPAWLRRMEEKGLPNQDRTSYILGSFTPKNDGGAA